MPFAVGLISHEVAHVKYLQTTGEFDDVTGCEILKWETLRNRFACVDLKNIIKLVHIVPRFKESAAEEDGSFFVNDKFLF